MEIKPMPFSYQFNFKTNSSYENTISRSTIHRIHLTDSLEACDYLHWLFIDSIYEAAFIHAISQRIVLLKFSKRKFELTFTYSFLLSLLFYTYYVSQYKWNTSMMHSYALISRLNLMKRGERGIWNEKQPGM